MLTEPEYIMNPVKYSTSSNGLISFLSKDFGLGSIIFIPIYIYVALSLFQIWHHQICRMIRNLSNMILNFFEEQEANILARENHELREKIKQNERTALGIHRETEELKQKIRLLQLELEDALEVAEVSESESDPEES